MSVQIVTHRQDGGATVLHVEAGHGGTVLGNHVTFHDVEAAKAMLDVYQDAELIALGYTEGDVATLRSAMADLDQLRRVFEGLEEVTPAKDFTVFASRVWGTGGLVPGA